MPSGSFTSFANSFVTHHHNQLLHPCAATVMLLTLFTEIFTLLSDCFSVHFPLMSSD